MATYQMLWDCSQCGTEGLLGVDHRFCPSCGAPQDPEARYFPKDEDKVAVEDHIYAGADKRCPSCDTANAAIAKHCVACGSPLDGASEVRRRDEQDAGTADSAKAARAEHRQDKQDEEKARIAAHGPAKSADPSSAARSEGGPPRAALLGCIPLGLLPLALIAVAVVVAMLCCGLFFWSTPTDVTATGHRWERSIAIEALSAISESNWRDSVPSDARGVSCSKKQRGSNSVADGQDCKTVRQDNGDGTFTETQKCTPRTRSEPVYDDYCTYTVDRWSVVDTKRASGGLKDTPRWPDARPSAKQRIGTKTETYEVSFKDGSNRTDWCGFPESKWRAIKVGSAFSGTRNLAGSLNCGSLSESK